MVVFFHISLLIFLLLPICSTSTPTSWIKAGYYYTGSEVPVSEINSQLFTHLICGFVYVNSSTYHLSINPHDVQHLSTFTNVVKRRNPSVTTLLSIWVGREHSPIFILMLNQSSHRKSFIESSISTAMLYGFSGIDLCGVALSTSTSLVDMSNLETLLDEWRATVKDFDAATSSNTTSGKSSWVLTMMGDYMPVLGSLVYPIDAMSRNLDWVHLKSYDYYVPTKANFTYPHAALYDPSKNYQINTDAGVKEWIRRGIPASKLVMGLPYHGYGWTLVNPNENGTGALSSGPAVTIDGSIAYKVIKSLLSSAGATSVYNASYVVNYCMIGPNWVNFDDVEAVRTKVSYAKKVGLLGYNVFQVGNDNNWVLSRAAQDEGEDPKNKKLLLASVLVATFMFIIILGVIICYLQPGVFKSRGIIKITESSLYKLKIMPTAVRLDSNASKSNLQVFSYATIKIATKNFSSENKLGEGGFGPVYKGRLRKGQEIAVKRLSKTSNQGLEEFKNEVTLTANLQHVNLARVLGYCTQREEMMLIYEYMPNSSLDLYLFDPSRRHLLDWRKRVHIIEGITQGLLYLQEYSNYTIVHRDLKASNILLDNQMNPKISDFGLARAFRKDEGEANTDRLVGTYGFVPPEYVRRGIYSMKHDVYSFGVLLLQIISGKRNTCLYGFCQNLNLLEYGYDLWKEGQGMKFVDSTLDDSSSSCKLLRCMQVALLCVQENPVDRPTMLEVFSMLKNENAAIISPKKPAFSIQNDEDPKEFQSKHREEMCSINDDSVSQVEPR